jgi:osmotically-inducible protein OsmY
MDDKQLLMDIIEELDWEPSIDSTHIAVAVENGVVTLTGHVPNFAQKATAESTVKRVHGVRAIAQELEVRPPHTATRADDEIAKRAVNILDWDVTVPTDAVQVKVQDGWVTLSGQVDWNYQRDAAEDNVRKLSGVMGLSNLIAIKPRVQSGDLKKRIEDALKRNALDEANAIHVEAVDGKVKLQGHVRSWHDRDLVKAAVWSASGVRDVEDHVTVG